MAHRDFETMFLAAGMPKISSERSLIISMPSTRRLISLPQLSTRGPKPSMLQWMRLSPEETSTAPWRAT